MYNEKKEQAIKALKEMRNIKAAFASEYLLKGEHFLETAKSFAEQVEALTIAINNLER